MVETAPRPVVDKHDEWTPADLVALAPEDWRSYEIIDGSLVVSPSPGNRHESIGAELRARLWAAQPDHLMVLGPIGVSVTRSYLIPDLVVASRERLNSDEMLDAPSSLLVVEVVSPGSETLDRVVKPAMFAAAGAPLYWRVETDPVSLTAYRLSGDTYVEVGSWGAGGTAELTGPFPVTIEIDRIG